MGLSKDSFTGRTLVVAKPDAMERGMVGEIISRLERRQLRIAAARVVLIDEELASRHYEEHRGKEFYEDLLSFIGRSPSLVMIVEGPQDVWKIVRATIGATDPLAAAPGTIRGDLATKVTENLVHGSDSPESAEREISVFFPDLVRA